MSTLLFADIAWASSVGDQTQIAKLRVRRPGPAVVRCTLGRGIKEAAQATFLDPIEGGSCSDYDYVCADPINSFDLDGKACRRCRQAWAIVRFGRNAPVTLAALILARAGGAKGCKFRTGGMIICTGAKRFYGGGGTAYGNVFLTPSKSVSRAVLRHETKHADQWAAIGPGFGPLYLVTYAVQGPCNVWEGAAGYEDGGYKC